MSSFVYNPRLAKPRAVKSVLTQTIVISTALCSTLALGTMSDAQVYPISGPVAAAMPAFRTLLRPAPSAAPMVRPPAAHSANRLANHGVYYAPQPNVQLAASVIQPAPSELWGERAAVGPQGHGAPSARASKGGVSFQDLAPNLEAAPSRGAAYRSDYGFRPGPRSRSGFKLSVDGHTLSGDGFGYETAQIRADTALQRANVQVRVDGLNVEPMLNVGISGDATQVPVHQPIEFVAHSNYEAFIRHAEVRIYTIGQGSAPSFGGHDAIGFLDTREPVLRVPLDGAGRGVVRLPLHLPSDLLYQLRVYDGQGRFDETELKPFSTTQTPRAATRDFGLEAYGKDATLRRNIPVKGGAVTVNGTQVPPGYVPFIFGRPVPVDPKGRFASQHILPFGQADIRVDMLDPSGRGLSLNRSVEIKSTDLFYVALGDLTIGQRSAIGLSDLTDPGDDFDQVEIAGRGAFYLKGRIKGDALITASLDTGEARLDDLLSNLNDKDPRQLLRRIDADAYYPVYGDGSTLREDAPTQGRFYVRLEKDDNTLMWGNFATAVTGTEIAQLDRGLYGALGDFNSDNQTRFGERRTQATVFAADPGTLPGRDDFRGTGGSLYYLRRQDLSVGSERLRVEVRDPLTGLIVSTRELTAYEDYDIDYLQGRIMLSEPLRSTVDDGQIVRTGGLSGYEAYLVARYEFTPGVTDLEGYTVGGRATHWLNDFVRVGVTGQNETTGTADQRVMAGDVLIRMSETSYLKGEYGETRGPGFNEGRSSDGGFLFDEIGNPGAVGVSAAAYRIEGQLDAADIAGRRLPMKARLRGVVEHQDAGYSGQGRIGSGAVDREELSLNMGVEDRNSFAVRYTRLRSELRGRSRALYADLSQSLRRGVVIAFGLRHSDQDPSSIANLSPNSRRGTGKRTDGTVELRLKPAEDTELSVFYQDTLSRDAGRFAFARYGLRGASRLGKRLRLSGEISEGDGGIGASAQLSAQGKEGTEYYLGYALSADSQDDLSTTRREASATYGTITAGTRQRFSDSLSIYGEEQIALGRTGRDLTHAYGVDFRPWDQWAFGASFEIGTINDDVLGDFEREAFSLSVAHTGEALRFSSNFEARFEDGILNGRDRDRTTYLTRNLIAFDANRDVELLGRFNMAWSESDQASILDADFVEAIAAIAYRPVLNDRLNLLGKYTYFETLSPGGQFDGNQRNLTARQRSQIVSADGVYDLTGRVSIGAKAAYRMGEVEAVRGSNTYVDSEAWLGVIRADYHVIDQWDMFAEGRYLTANLADNSQLGAVIGIHRHFNDHIKVGAGYSFSRFSDDLTDFNNDADGWFINIVGKL